MDLPREGSRTTQEGILVSTAMDWCWVDGKAVPFRVVAKQQCGANIAGTVRLTGQAAHVRGSLIPSCQGDEAGVGGGVLSGTRGGICEPKTFSSTVRFEGRGAVRHDDVWWMNNRNTWGKLTYLGDLNEYPAGGTTAGQSGVTWDVPPITDSRAAPSQGKAGKDSSSARRDRPGPAMSAPGQDGVRISGRGDRAQAGATPATRRDGMFHFGGTIPVTAWSGPDAPLALTTDNLSQALGPEAALLMQSSPTFRQMTTKLSEMGWRFIIDNSESCRLDTGQRIIHIPQQSLADNKLIVRELAAATARASSRSDPNFESENEFIRSMLVQRAEIQMGSLVIRREILGQTGTDIGLSTNPANLHLYDSFYDTWIQDNDHHAVANRILFTMFQREQYSPGVDWVTGFRALYPIMRDHPEALR